MQGNVQKKQIACQFLPGLLYQLLQQATFLVSCGNSYGNLYIYTEVFSTMWIDFEKSLMWQPQKVTKDAGTFCFDCQPNSSFASPKCRDVCCTPHRWGFPTVRFHPYNSDDFEDFTAQRTAPRWFNSSAWNGRSARKTSTMIGFGKFVGTKLVYAHQTPNYVKRDVVSCPLRVWRDQKMTIRIGARRKSNEVLITQPLIYHITFMMFYVCWLCSIPCRYVLLICPSDWASKGYCSQRLKWVSWSKLTSPVL